jgi:hypothetical protein
MEPGAGVKTADCCQGEFARMAAAIRGSFEPIIVQKDQLAVGRQANIKLHPFAAEGVGPPEPDKGVFRRLTRCPAVPDYPREPRLGAIRTTAVQSMHGRCG